MFNQKKKYFIFPKLHFKHLLFLFFLIIAFIKKGIEIYFEENQRLAVEFIKLYIYNIGDFFTIIPYIIMRKRMKIGKENNYPVSTYYIKYIYFNLNNKKFKFMTLRNIFILTIVDFIAQISTVIYYIINEDKNFTVKQANLNSTLIFHIIFVIIFSILILHTKFYKHHLFAFSIDALCFIALTIIDLTKIFRDKENNITMSIIYMLIIILVALLYSLENVISKYIFLVNFVSTYGLILIKSSFHFVYLIIFSIPFIFRKIDDEKGESRIIFSMIADVFKDKSYIFLFIGYTITSFFHNNLCYKIIDIFSPNHFTISRLLENVGIFIIDLIMDGYGSIGDLIVKIIMYILLILAAFIYNEFLVINICGLSKNTKLFLDYEVEDELLFEKQSDDSSNLSSDTNDRDNTFGLNEIELVEK